MTKNILIINTIPDGIIFHKMKELLSGTQNNIDWVDASVLNISHCIGCNYCWLKTPGICTIKDDYEILLKKMICSDAMWVISETSFGFLSHPAKNIFDRVMPLVTMYLHFENGEMRHIMRYENKVDIGIVYSGEGNQEYLERWCKRAAVNFGSKSLGVFSESRIKEAVSCM
ncbi:MAG: flavodoxin family protein [Acetatifactor sp.]